MQKYTRLYMCFSILIVGVPYNEPQFMGLLAIKQVFISVNRSFEYMLIFIAFMFGFTTIMAVGFYVQQACIYLFGLRFKKLYIVLYVIIYSFVGLSDTIWIFDNLDIAYTIGGFINLIAIFLLLPQIKEIWQEYLDKKNTYE